MIIREYIVHKGRGHIRVEVAAWVVEKRGERTAVAEYAWRKLMGKGQLDEDVDKHSPTRAFLRTQIDSRYQSERTQVYDTFKESIRITLVGIGHATG